MRNILSNLATKKVAGTVLVGASLVVGFAVVNNFSGGSQKPADEVYQSRLTDDAYNNVRGGGSISRAEIEKQMSVQDRYDARFLKGTSESADTDAEGPYESGFNAGEGFVYSSDGSPVAGGAYGQGGAYDANGQYIAGVRGAYANGDTYQPFNSTYEQGEGGVEMGGGRGASADAAAYGERQFKAVQGAAAGAVSEGKDAAKDGKEGKDKASEGKNAKDKARPSTQINKLAASSGGSAFGGNVAGGAGGAAAHGGSVPFNTGDSGRNSDNNFRALPQTNAQAEGNAFKFGRTGAIGGFNVGLKGTEVKGGTPKSRGAAGDAELATRYSKAAVSSNRKTEEKALAEAAFDGSNIRDLSPTVSDDATIGQVGRDLMTGLQMDGFDDASLAGDGEAGIGDTAELAAELKDLQNTLTILKVVTLLAAVAFSIGIYFLRQIEPYGNIFAAILTVIAAVILVGLCLWMKDIVDQMADEKFKYNNQTIDFGDQYWSVIKTGIISAVIVALGWTNKWEEIFDKVKNIFTKPGPIMAGGEDAIIPEDMV